MIALLALLLAVVNSPSPSVTYACDGVTAAYTVSFPYQAATDLQATSTTPAGAATILTQTTDWTVNLASTSSTATLTLNSPATKCPSGNTLKIARNLALTQPTSFKAQTTFTPTLHEQVYDRTVMQIQQVDAKVGATDIKAYVDAAINNTLTGGTVVQPLTWALTGDGTTSIFSIPNAVVSNANLYEVTIDGLVQAPITDYTVDSGTAKITFVSTPAFNAKISVRSLGYARALSVLTPYQCNSVGCVSRSTASKLGDVISATDFFANGVSGSPVDPTGALDSGLGIQAALNSGTKGVFLPCGTYKTSTTISIPATVSLTGEIRPCTTINYTGSGWAIYFNDMQNGRIDNLTISLTSSALGGVRLRTQTTTAETRHVLSAITVTAVTRTVSQIGFLMSTEASVATMYHNRFIDIFCNQMDICMKWTATVNNQGPNGNFVDGLGTQGQGTGILLTDATDNSFTNLIFLGTSVANAKSIQIVDSGGHYGASGNTFKFISEQGVGTATTVSVGSGAATTIGNGNNIFTGYANDATSISDSYGGTAVNANKYFLNTGILVPRLQGSPPGSPLLLYGTSAGSLLAGDGTAVPAALAGLNIASTGSAFVTTSDGTVEGFLGNDSTTIYVGSVTNHPVAFRVSNSTKVTLNTSGNLVFAGAGNIQLGTVLQAALGTPANGTVVYCSDCTIANPCAGGGTGALAKRLNGVWVCN